MDGDVKKCATWGDICAHVAAFVAAGVPDPFAQRHVIVPSKGHGRALAHYFAASQSADAAICAGVQFETLAGLRRRLAQTYPAVEPQSIAWELAASGIPADGFCAVLLGASRSEDHAFLDELSARCAVQRVEYAPSNRRSPLAQRYSRLTSLNTDFASVQSDDEAAFGIAVASPLPRNAQEVSTDPQTTPQIVLTPCAEDGQRLTGPTLLHRVQTELRSGFVGDVPRQLDGSVQIHASHGPNRQVEVLRDVLCALFDDDPQLEPRDVLVLCTNLREYAPLIEATFSPQYGFDVSELGASPTAAAPHPGRRLRVQVAHHALANRDPVIEVLLAALRLNTMRGTITELLMLATMPPIADFFGFDNVVISRLRELLAAAHANWGMDSGARARFGLPNLRQGTWLAGVERLSVSLLLPSAPGEAMATASPIAGVEARDAELIGALAELVSRLRKCAATGTPATSAQWALRLREWMNDLVGLGEAAQFGGWSMTAANDVIADLAAGIDLSAVVGGAITVDAGTGAVALDNAGGTHRRPQTVERAEVVGDSGPDDEGDPILDAASVATWLRQRPIRTGRPNYFNGNLLVTNLGDLDAVPHKVICVLGLDDRFFPGRTGVDVVTEADDGRVRARQRLFNAILAAEETLVVITQGADPRSNESLPPSVCIQDMIEMCRLRDECSAWPGRDPSIVPDKLVRKHSLQPHSWANFTTESDAPPFSFDQDALQGALALQNPSLQAAPLMRPQPAPTSTSRSGDQNINGARDGHAGTGAAGDDNVVIDVTLDQLNAFYLHPARELLKRRAGLSLTRWSAELDESIPVNLGPLQRWQVGQRLLDARLQGASAEATHLDARLDGLLPPGESGGQVFTDIAGDVDRIIASLPAQVGATASRSFTSIDAVTGEGRLVGSVETTANVLVNVRFGGIKAKQLASVWLSLLACAASNHPRLGLVCGTRESVRLRAPLYSDAVAILEELLRLRASGLADLLPLPVATGAAFTDAGNRSPEQALRRAWQGDAFSNISGEADEAWKFFFPAGTLEQLRSVPALPDDPLAPGTRATDSRFERLATWFWRPLLQHKISMQEFSAAVNAGGSMEVSGR
ncbi:MAG: exodeoxyribonuclease V subunit gamma [Propionibacteriaceae bacterium]|jgi:exodeoxyribonuclease V gamma subunit|nr:exodeoxyribonuclease V subunit gamma [Propionibacteriaceae bacterium]